VTRDRFIAWLVGPFLIGLYVDWAGRWITATNTRRPVRAVACVLVGMLVCGLTGLGWLVGAGGQVEYCHKYEVTGKQGAAPTGVDHIFVKHPCFERKVCAEGMCLCVL
jgi:quinol-cytochrome oxidoreductase complex cytochrome b subunit